MSQPRYQIFVSSTFQDLEKERQAILNAILKLNQFPAGMEIFPATNDTAWELIKKVIEDSDYYVLVIGGRYGSMDESGISYTEKEYDFAVSQNIPVLAFVHSDLSSIPLGKSETDSKIRKKLEAFKKKVERHHCNFWKTTDELKEKVITSLSQSIVMNPQKGWIKAGRIDNTELLSRLADLQKRYDDLINEIIKLKESSIHFDPTQFAFNNQKLKVYFNYEGSTKTWHCEISWHNLFFSIGRAAIGGCNERDIKDALSFMIMDYFENGKEYFCLSNEIQSEPDEIDSYKISEESFEVIRNQVLALELISIKSNAYTPQNPSFDEVYISRVWELTAMGRKLFLNETAVKQNNLE
ncbi:MAG: DUF4062 domain-containing protein [Pyrinomonadaceae bacterium]